MRAKSVPMICDVDAPPAMGWLRAGGNGAKVLGQHRQFGARLRGLLQQAARLLVVALGVVLAIPIKRSLINQEKLKFPSGTAAAVLLQSLYTEGSEALVKARALLVAGFVSGLLPLLKDLEIIKSLDDKGKVVRAALLPASFKIFDWLPGISGAGKAFPLSAWNIKFDYDLAVIAAGALVGLRATVSMIAGGLILAIGIGPVAMSADWTNPLGVLVHAVNRPQSAWKEIGVWFGAPVLVAAGLLSFAFQWRTIVKAFRGLAGKGNLKNPKITIVECSDFDFNAHQTSQRNRESRNPTIKIGGVR